MLNMDVCIVDGEFREIATSAIYNHNLDRTNTPEHSGLLRKTMKMSVQTLLLYPENSDACSICPCKEDCHIRFQISVPVRLKNKEFIGAIGLVGATEKQEQYVYENEALINTFLIQLSELLASKAQLLLNYEMQEEFVNQLSFTLNNVDECIIIYNSQKQIENMNQQAQQFCKIRETDAVGRAISVEETGADYLQYTEIRFGIGEKSYEVAGTIFDIPMNNRRLMIFQDINALQLNVMKSAAMADKITLSNIVGESRQIMEVKQNIQSVANSHSNVLIMGESGTGKELVARALHEQGERKAQPFVAINCAAIPDSLLESELFGYVRGAFTGASPNGKIGKIELANKGTLFLDEIGDMPFFVQAKILRVLEEREVVRIGDYHPVKVDIRIISATNRDLKQMVRERTFREDLYYRLNVIPLQLPPLRERKGDIRCLTDNFLMNYSEKFNKTIKYIEPEFYEALETYSWPGNIRELKNIIEFVINMMDGTSGRITKDLLGERTKEASGSTTWNLKDNEYRLIQSAIREFTAKGYTYEEIAEKLGIGVATFYRKLKKLHEPVSF
ncbi:sigma-54 interaction domain-containing protein [Enterocloster citroniae]|uniref:sigma-54 interaction domain-containing protein n=2 Tax=Enterocloster citroniae TaxID=358743 RepID=UPI001D07DA54|nr:sigma 54-interacting transcriptional regulator [Enterocloster citroniae]